MNFHLSSQRIKTAEDAVRVGLSIIPTKLDKRPLIDTWKPFQKQAATIKQVRQWSAQSPAGWAMITGEVSNVITLDFDGPAGIATMRKLGLDPHRQTPSGGFHVDFIHPGHKIKTLNGKSKTILGEQWPGLDIRADGGYAVIIGKSDKGEYRWLRDFSPESVDVLSSDELKDFLGINPPKPVTLPAPPAKRVPQLESHTAARVDSGRLIQSALDRASADGRNNSGFWLACQLRDNGYSNFDADSVMTEYAGRVPSTNTKGQHEPYGVHEARASLREAYSKGAREAWTPKRPYNHTDVPVLPGTEKKSDLWDFPLTELGNAERMVLLHGKSIRFCHPWGKWLVWDGRRWALDDTAEIQRRAQDTVRKMFASAGKIEDSKLRDDAWKLSRQSEKNAQLTAMITLAATQKGMPVLPDQVDSDPWLLNCSNGTLDLRNGQLYPHRPEDLITKLAPVAYDADAKCPSWLRFQDRVMNGDAELIRFKQRALGYGLTGVVTEKRSVFINHGSGNNGKTTELETEREMLGDYSGQIRIETLMEQSRSSGNSPSPDIADLRGLRLVVSSEPSEGQRLSESTVKYLTSMGTIKARQLHKGNFEFRQTWKIFMDCNHRPEVRGTDNAIWNRIGLVPFDVVIPDEEIDRDLPAKLRAELPGILAWAVAGCMEWQAVGLEPPATVKAATDEYRSEMDAIGRFIEDRCIRNPSASARGNSLYSEYQKWCEESGEKPYTMTSFGRHLTERTGFAKDRDNKGIIYLGVGLRV